MDHGSFIQLCGMELEQFLSHELTIMWPARGMWVHALFFSNECADPKLPTILPWTGCKCANVFTLMENHLPFLSPQLSAFSIRALASLRETCFPFDVRCFRPQSSVLSPQHSALT